MPQFQVQSLTSFQEFERFLGRFTNYERVRHFRYDKETLGLTRIQTLLSRMGDPHRTYPSVHIAGTKGKGSTSLMLESLLLASRYRVGTYTSPHVEHLRERVRLGGQPISEAALLSDVNSLLPLLARMYDQSEALFPSFFELMTALAMGAFRRESVNWAIFEVGLGGRLDATNVVAPRWTVITSIGLEHTAQLGKRLSEIAQEKAGIIKPGVAVFLGAIPREAATEIRRVAAEKDAQVVAVTSEKVRRAPHGKLFLKALEALVPAGPVVGPALRTDFALALEVYESILAAEGEAASAEVISAALESLELPARIEILAANPWVVLDSAHTPDSLRALDAALEEQDVPRPRTVVFSLSKGKEVTAVLECLGRLGEEVIFTRADDSRSLPPAELRRAFGAGEVIDRPEAAFARAIDRSGPVIITGSFYLSGRLRPLARRHVMEKGEVKSQLPSVKSQLPNPKAQ